LKAGDFENDHPNDNGPNASVKGCYNEKKTEWDKKFGMTQYTPAHMHSIVACTWEAFKAKSAPVAISTFKKT
jgi:hypothetical protein